MKNTDSVVLMGKAPPFRHFDFSSRISPMKNTDSVVFMEKYRHSIISNAVIVIAQSISAVVY